MCKPKMSGVRDAFVAATPSYAVFNFNSEVIKAISAELHLGKYSSWNERSEDRRTAVLETDVYRHTFPTFKEYYMAFRNVIDGLLRNDPTLIDVFDAWCHELMAIYDDAWAHDEPVSRTAKLAKVCAVIYASQLSSEECVDQDSIYLRRGTRCLPENVSSAAFSSAPVPSDDWDVLPPRHVADRDKFLPKAFVNAYNASFRIQGSTLKPVVRSFRVKRVRTDMQDHRHVYKSLLGSSRKT